MTQENLTIGALSAQTSCNIPTIRYYEQIGLLPRPARAANGHRYYRHGDIKRLTFIKRCRDFGFPIEQVRALVSLFEDGDRSCIEVRDMAQEQLDTVRAKMEEIRQLEASLSAFVESCDQACRGGTTRDCVIVVDLSNDCPARVDQAQASCCAPPKKKPAAGRMTATAIKRK